MNVCILWVLCVVR